LIAADVMRAAAYGSLRRNITGVFRIAQLRQVKSLPRSLYFQVILAIVLGGAERLPEPPATAVALPGALRLPLGF
jgi:hypothetical protein